jgi:beta-N-acetylhexosaminidase
VTLAAIFGLSGPALTSGERALFRSADPAGYILFGRNCLDPEQLRALTDELRALHGRDDLLILVDQEGGRVARLGPPRWPAFPAASVFAALYEKAPMTAIEAARINAAAMAAVLAEAGITANCAPVLDLARDGAHAIVGDRSFGAEPMQVAALGRAVLDGLAQGGVLGCIKHLPGHGRARADSHSELPVIEATREELEEDFAPFRSLTGRAALGMVAHIVYSALDAGGAASISPTVITDTIRGDIGFGGLLLSDDIAMDALSGPGADRACAVVEAGCDLALHCSGVLAEMEAVAAVLGDVTAGAGERLAQAVAAIPMPPPAAEYAALAAKRDALLA